MARKLSSIAPDWWDYTTLDADIIRDAAALTPEKMLKLSRSGFKVVMYDTIEEFYLAEALEYINAWKQSTPDNPVGLCGPIGPTEQLPLVARLVNDLNLNVKSAHFWGMDEWYLDGKEAPPTHPLSFEKADRELCFSRIRKDLVMPDANLHFPKANTAAYHKTWNAGVRCAVMQGGQGDVKHWAFNDPPRRAGKFKNSPPSPAEYRKLTTRVVDLHPLTIAQNARTFRSEALGLQRSAAPRWEVQEQPALPGRISQADHACGGPASPDHRAERPHVQIGSIGPSTIRRAALGSSRTARPPRQNIAS